MSMSINNIQSLPHSLRSGFLLFDFARLVQELIFNSIDANASTVSVFVGVATCYLKVVDDGYGITRDGLDLLGQRYATSKFNHLVQRDAEIRSFGFRGETLASISDISLLEVVTKARGRPNGYRKVMKGSKCLCLKICDDMKDVGTTVVVRDLFYNQPVRRKYIQSSPKKVLQSVKKCVLRIALVHSKVSFKVVDIESEDILLSILASSPMSLLASCFGIDVCTHLQELNISDEKLNLSGYISGPCDNLTTKAFQYVYINSRFVCKGPIHKLVNQLSAKFECYDRVNAVKGAENRKRKRPQTCPAFILNITCHRTFYDLTFEQSKTYVEFKDWVRVLTLIEEAIQNLWKENISNTDIIDSDQTSGGAGNSVSKEDFCSEKIQGNSIIGKRKCTIQSHQTSLDANFSDSDILTKEDNHWSHRKQDIIPTQPLVPQENELNFFSQSNQNGDFPCSKSMPGVSRNSKNKMYISDNKFLAVKDYLLVNEAISGERFRDEDDDNNFSTLWGYDSFEGNFQKSDDELEMIWDVKKPVLKSCSSQGIVAHENSLFTVGACDYESHNQSCDLKSRSFWQDQASSFEHFPTVTRKSCSYAAFDTLHRPFGKSIPIFEEHLDGNDRFSSDSVTEVDTVASDHVKLDSEWCSLTSDSFSHDIHCDVEPYTDTNIHGGRSRSIKAASPKLFLGTEENYCRYGFDVLEKRSIQENCTTCPSSSGLDAGSGHFHQRHNSNKKYFPECNDIISDETKWLSFYSHCNSQNKNQSGLPKHETEHICQTAKGRSRSHSAPPFYRSKRRVLSLSCHFSEKPNKDPACRGSYRKDRMKSQDLKEPETSISKDERFTQYVSLIEDAALLKETTSKEDQDSPSCWSKWRNCCSQTSNDYKLHDIHDQNNILDISSGFLHLAGDSLVPESISKTSLEDAIVLKQVDKKFIPVVAGRILAVVDQHAADERIRLEELRQKVLSGEAKTVTFLESEQELKVPELGYQRLENYAEEIKEWGWICNIHAQDSRSFKRNLNLLHRKRTAITLTAVPCILGVNLTDVDLMEFLQQLADTDGSSTIPPSVLRILNSKACRGAIMFGDSLLPSECSLLISELKQTSLCFQCAHGRPTTVPVVNLEELHKQIAKMALLNADSTALCPRQITFHRAAQRLSLATT